MGGFSFPDKEDDVTITDREGDVLIDARYQLTLLESILAQLKVNNFLLKKMADLDLSKSEEDFIGREQL